MTDYPYGDPPSWWGKGKEAAHQAAVDAIALSVRVGDRMRAAVGDKGKVIELRPVDLFVDPVEVAEATRLIELSRREKKDA